MKRGLLIIMSGPSGVGKGTLRQMIMDDKDLNLYFSVSLTTRLPRAGEQNGVDYYYVTEEEFKEDIAKGNLLEHNYFVSHYYGTPKDKTEEMRNKGVNVLLEIDVNGAKQVMANCGEEDKPLSFFILPPSIEALEARIRGRRSETEEVIQERLGKAKREMSEAPNYTYSVINDNLEEAAQKIATLIKEEIAKNN